MTERGTRVTATTAQRPGHSRVLGPATAGTAAPALETLLLGSHPLRAGWQVLPRAATLFVVAPPPSTKRAAGRLIGRPGERPLGAGGFPLRAVAPHRLGTLAGSGHRALAADAVPDRRPAPADAVPAVAR
jgi:hypothetical protein